MSFSRMPSSSSSSEMAWEARSTERRSSDAVVRTDSSVSTRRVSTPSPLASSGWSCRICAHLPSAPQDPKRR